MAGPILRRSEGIARGDFLVSSNQKYQFGFEPKGDGQNYNLALVMRTPAIRIPIWTQELSSVPVSLVMHDDGYLQVFNGAGQSIWATGTSANSAPGSEFFLGDDGDGVVRTPEEGPGIPTWRVDWRTSSAARDFGELPAPDLPAWPARPLRRQELE